MNPMTTPTSITAAKRGEATYRLAVHEPIEGKLFAGHEEDGLIAMLCDRIRPGDVVFDVGSHAGYHALAFATAVGDAGVVHAIEPNPHCLAYLRENIALNPALRVEAHHLAITDSPGEIELRHGAAYERSARLRDAEGEQATIVPTTSIDAFAAEHGRPTILKIDVEGAEDLVFAGATRTLADPRLRSVMLELHPDWLAGGPGRGEAIGRQITDAGFVEVYREPRRQQIHLLYDRPGEGGGA